MRSKPTPSSGGRGGEVQTLIRNKRKQPPYGDCLFRLVAGVGFEPHDLRVMSPTSYQAALPRDIQLRKVVPETGLEPVRDFHRTGF